MSTICFYTWYLQPPALRKLLREVSPASVSSSNRRLPGKTAREPRKSILLNLCLIRTTLVPALQPSVAPALDRRATGVLPASRLASQYRSLDGLSKNTESSKLRQKLRTPVYVHLTAASDQLRAETSAPADRRTVCKRIEKVSMSALSSGEVSPSKICFCGCKAELK